MKRAVRAECLVLDGPVPDWVFGMTTATVEDPVEFVDPGTGEVRNVLQERVVTAAIRLRDGRVLLPRNAIADHLLEDAGYVVTAHGVNPARRMTFKEVAENIELRPKQMPAYTAIQAADGDMYIVLGTGRGKTVIAIRIAADVGHPILVFVDNGGLMEQWVERATSRDLFGLPEEEIGRCTSSFDKWQWKGRSVCITTFQSFVPALARGEISEEFFRYFGWVMFDEAHVVKTPQRFSLLSLFRARRVQLSATPEKFGWERIAYMHAGAPVIEDREPDLLPDVFIRAATTTRAERQMDYPLSGMESYRKMCDDMLGTERRNPDAGYFLFAHELIEDLRAQGRTTMVLSPRKRFLRSLAEYVDGMTVIDGDVDFRYRPGLLTASSVVGVTTAIGEKALDRIDLDTLIMLLPVGSRARTRMRQGAGRVLRYMADKNQPQVYILYPPCGYGRKIAAANAEMCETFGFDVKEKPKFDAEVARARRGLDERAQVRARPTGFGQRRRGRK